MRPTAATATVPDGLVRTGNLIDGFASDVNDFVGRAAGVSGSSAIGQRLELPAAGAVQRRGRGRRRGGASHFDRPRDTHPADLAVASFVDLFADAAGGARALGAAAADVAASGGGGGGGGGGAASGGQATPPGLRALAGSMASWYGCSRR